MSLATLGAISATTNELPLPDTSALSLGEALILSGGGGTTEAVVIRSIASGRNIGVTVNRGALGTLQLAHTAPTTVSAYDPSGGGSGTVLQRTVTLTDAQIKALPTVPVEIIPAPGSGKVLNAAAFTSGPSFVGLAFDWTADYSHIDAALSIVFRLGAGGPYAALTSSLSKQLLAWGADAVWVVGAADQQAGGSDLNDRAILEDQPLFISIDNAAAGNLTGGNPSNSLTVTVVYTVFDI